MKTILLESTLISPSKIVCIGRNYLAHIKELGNETPQAMVIFCKPNSAISDSLSAEIDEPLHFEGEICFTVRQGRLHAVGYGLDLTKRSLQSELKSRGLPWERAKAFDGAACFSEFVALEDIDLSTLSLTTEINGEIRQQGGYDLMIHKPDQILAEVAQFMTLEDGDIIMTGTPSGVGQVGAGDRFTGCVKTADKILVSHQWLAQ